MKKWVFSALVLVTLVAGVLRSQDGNYVAEIVSDASRTETILHVRIHEPIQPGRTIMIEPRDGGLRDTYTVKHVYGEHVLLIEKLERDFLAGSRIFQ